MSESRRYHHGDLKAALIEGAIELIAERGVRGFSLAELSRRVGVTVAAPYRHFTGRDELLAAVAVRGLYMFRQALTATAPDSATPELRLAAMASSYVRFAAEQQAMFGVVFGVGLDKKGSYPELRQAYEAIEDMVRDCVDELCPGEPEVARRLADAVEATAHGQAALLTDQPGAHDRAAIDHAAEQAACATMALIQGRAALRAGVSG